MSDNLSAGEVLALSRDNNNDFMMNAAWNNPFIYMVWMAMFSNGGWFNNRNNNLENAFTRSDMFEGFNNQDINSQLRGITNGLCDGFYANNTNMLQMGNNIGREIMENRFTGKECCLFS